MEAEFIRGNPVFVPFFWVEPWPKKTVLTVKDDKDNLYPLIAHEDTPPAASGKQWMLAAMGGVYFVETHVIYPKMTFVWLSWFNGLLSEPRLLAVPFGYVASDVTKKLDVTVEGQCQQAIEVLHCPNRDPVLAKWAHLLLGD